MIRTDLLIRPCNLCGEENQIRVLFVKNGYHIVKCEKCSLVYTNDIPSDEELSRIYSEGFFKKGNKFSDGMNSPLYLNSRKRLERILALPDIILDRWLDVGCATGEFIIAANQYVKNVEGVEFSEYAVEQAHSRYGLNIHCGDFLKINLDQNQYDVITAWDFIEHVADPNAVIMKLLNLLKPGGYLIMTTGDISSFSARVTRKYWHLMTPPKHLYYFSPITIHKYLSKNQAIVTSNKFFGKYVPFDFALWKLFDQTIPSLSKYTLSFSKAMKLGNLVPAINLFDIMEVCVKKPRLI